MGRRRDGLLERVWRARLRRYEQGASTVADFCAAEGVSPASFYGWRRRLQRSKGRTKPAARTALQGGRRSGDAQPLFVPVSVAASSTEVRIELPGGAVVCVPPAADEHLVRTCLRAALAAQRDAEAR